MWQGKKSPHNTSLLKPGIWFTFSPVSWGSAISSQFLNEGSFFSSLMMLSLSFSPSTSLPHRCLQNYIPAHSLTLSCPVCRQTSILPEKGVSALQNNFFITNLMDVLQRTPDNSIEESSILETVTAVAAGKPLSCPNHDGNVSEMSSSDVHRYWCVLTGLVI